jgi:hypothetical protein
MLTYAAFNEALRNMEEGVEHPLPVLVTILARAVKKPHTHTHTHTHTHIHSHTGAHDVAAVTEKILCY